MAGKVSAAEYAAAKAAVNNAISSGRISTSTDKSGNTTYTINSGTGAGSSVTANSAGKTIAKNIASGSGSSGGSSSGSSGGSSSSSSGSSSGGSTIKTSGGTTSSASSGTDWATKYAGNAGYDAMVKQYGTEAAHKALDYTASGGKDKATLSSILTGGAANNVNDAKSYQYTAPKTGTVWDSINEEKNKKIADSFANYSFGNDVKKQNGAYDMNTRNVQIAQMMKDNGINPADANTVQEFLSKYSQSYADSSDEDKMNTANKIFENYNYINSITPSMNEDTLNSEAAEEEVPELDTSLLDDLTMDEEIDDVPEIDSAVLEDEDDDYYEDTYDMNEDIINGYEDEDLDIKGDKDNNDALSDAEREANREASMAAWQRATNAGDTRASGNEIQANGDEQGESLPQEDQTVTDGSLSDTASYEAWGDKIKAGLEGLGLYQRPVASQELQEDATAHAMEEGHEGETPEQRVEGAEAEMENNPEASVPEYNTEEELDSSYDEQMAQFDNMPATEENVNNALAWYMQGKDSAALYAVRNNLSPEWYQQKVKKLGSNSSLQNLIRNYRQGGQR